MTRKEAIERIKIILEECIEDEDAVSYVTSYDADALDMAIKALEQQPCEDTISRQAAVDVAKQYWYKPDIAKALEELPSAQPEIIRCKDCRNNHWCNIQEAAMAGDNFFCGAAERRTDEQ